ncbi:DUF6402 family protein [Paraburkholderia sp. J67]|uniref:DUF6402 family protein n=1 Tax=Paraburkholderia sp. J67 TaxID=2805435 RepID=UPI002ABE0022|nr:DUF6402 family protein [Paraburkholderia sp. J67]
MPEAYIDGSAIPYCKINFLRLSWTVKESCQCVRGVGLSSDQPPPADKSAPPPRPKPEPVRKKDAADTLIAILDGIERFKAWRDAPPAPRPPQKPKVVPRFDIQQFPDAMRAEAMPVAAKLMERWFAGQLNYSPTDADEDNEINQDGNPYPEGMIDRTTIKMKWVLSYGRAKRAYDELIETRIYNERAYAVLQRRLRPYADRIDLKPWDLCASDLHLLHKHFQFQRMPVGVTLAEKNGMIVVPSYALADVAGVRWLDSPVVVGASVPSSIYEEGKVFFPVRNRDFREWQLKHKRGGDFIIFSNYISLRLPMPIRVFIG